MIVYLKEYYGLSFKYYEYFNVLQIRIKLEDLGFNDLTPDNYDRFRLEYHDRLYDIFPFIEPLGHQHLSRIDYKIDFDAESKENKQLYFKLFKKVNKKHRYLKQEKEYKTSIYFKSKSQNINVYDKLVQYVNKCSRLGKEPDLEYVERIKNVIRLEVQIKRPKIRYMKNEYDLMDCLSNYISPSDKIDYLGSLLIPIFYQGNYYNQYWSNKILQEHYTKNMTNKLLNMQKDISLYGVQKIKDNYKQFNTYIKQLQAAGINPIPIPKGEGITYLENPIHIAA